MKRLLFVILIGVVLALLFRHYCFEVIYIASSSMEPTYSVKDELIINKIVYLFKAPGRGDIVLVQSPMSDKEMVKRIIGLPFEIISLKDKQVYIDGKLLEEDYVQYIHGDVLFVGDNIKPFTIPENKYFVMGDNRDVSRDSRDWLEEEGPQMETVPENNIKGKVFSLY